MAAICQLQSMHLHKKVESSPKQPSCKKVCGPQENHWKKDMKFKVVAKK